MTKLKDEAQPPRKSDDRTAESFIFRGSWQKNQILEASLCSASIRNKHNKGF